MTDVFEALANPNHRKLIEVLNAHPGLTAGEAAAKAKLAEAEVKKCLTKLHDAGLVTARAAGKDKHYSVSAAGLNKVASWVIKLTGGPKTKLDKQVDDLADKLGEWIATGGNWLGDKFAENTGIKSPEDLGREIGRRLADAKKQADATAGDQIREVVKEVKKRVNRK
jgi:predicted ArsR family transcriptional regulator